MSMYDLMLYMPLHLSQPVLLTVQLSAVHHSTAAPSGERVPRPESEKLNQLCEGIYLLSKEKAASKRTSASITPFTKDEIYTAFTNTLKQPDNSRLCENFNHLLLASSVSLADLARFLNYDSSYLSRIPSDPEWFCSETARFIVLRTPPADRIFIEKLTGQSIKDINDSAALCQLLSGWLLNTNNVSPQINQMQSFLEKLDQFDLNNFIRSICFDELKVPTMPIQLPGSRSYFGIREFMTAELDYLKATVLSPSMENVIMYSDMPMEEMSKDPDFPKKWMFGMAMLLKKGLHINMIPDLTQWQATGVSLTEFQCLRTSQGLWQTHLFRSNKTREQAVLRPYLCRFDGTESSHSRSLGHKISQMDTKSNTRGYEIKRYEYQNS